MTTIVSGKMKLGKEGDVPMLGCSNVKENYDYFEKLSQSKVNEIHELLKGKGHSVLNLSSIVNNTKVGNILIEYECSWICVASREKLKRHTTELSKIIKPSGFRVKFWGVRVQRGIENKGGGLWPIRKDKWEDVADTFLLFELKKVNKK